ncbi:transcription factor [Ganoderma sinense ZZ0214-1]|uniref:Transcription factor n=1 Tax=Ganoderma sinense ZZ0214-1 TaxID=1077348 RepID=A0A2G8SB24_9APHY|nr:transcription factor [Ganoderma sinense ZZ0214-1]
MSRDHAGPSGPTSTVADSTLPHWTPAHVLEPSFWDGRSPQYIAPSALYQGSPPHPQESHAAASAFSPEQILSGAHLGSQPSRARSPAPFQYTSSSLSAALSQPGSVSHSPNPHSYYPSQAYSPRHEPSELSSINISSSDTRSRAYETHDYEYLPHDDTALSESYQHGTGHTAAGISSANEFTGNSSSEDPVSLHSVTIPESPASPSQAGSPSSPGSPASSSGGDLADFSNLPAIGDTITAPRSYYLTDAEKALRPQHPRKVRNPLVPARLSSSLAATTDPSVLAYACGHRDCWPEGAMTSRNAYVTSKELSDHSKGNHGGDLGGSRPFRCGLTGCEKSWKSINGLQYHLQISKYHFQQALATRTDNPDLGGSAAPVTPSIEQETREGEVATSGAVEPPCGADCAEAEGTAPSRTHATPVPQRTPEKTGAGSAPAPDKPKRKLHPCPHPGCSKEYKQLSGLRYHLTHGHADALPLQLDVVPPTLARMVAEKEGLTRH